MLRTSVRLRSLDRCDWQPLTLVDEDKTPDNENSRCCEGESDRFAEKDGGGQDAEQGRHGRTRLQWAGGVVRQEPEPGEVANSGDPKGLEGERSNRQPRYSASLLSDQERQDECGDRRDSELVDEDLLRRCMPERAGFDDERSGSPESTRDQNHPVSQVRPG